MTASEYRYRLREYDQLILDAEGVVARTSTVVRALREERARLMVTYAQRELAAL